MMKTDEKNDHSVVILLFSERLIFRNDPLYSSVNGINVLCMNNTSLDANEEKGNWKATALLKF